MPSEEEYTQRAEARIRDILTAEHAVVTQELAARIGEAGYADSGLNIDPHHITTALHNLTNAHEVVWAKAEATRGGKEIATIQPADQHRRSTAIKRAAARKRLLYSRYLNWANGDKRHPHGLIGPAGEAATRTGILSSGGLLPARADAGEVSSLLNVELPGAPDSAGVCVPFVDGLPSLPITVIIEVKNIRSWIYPHSEELYQLLDKACVLQRARPESPVLPVLVCRKVQKPTFGMARQLGFLVIDLEAQFAGDVDEAKLDEVRNELGFSDIRAGTGPSLRVRDRFQKTIPEVASTYAATWKTTAANSDFASHIHQLRYAEGSTRTTLMQHFRQSVKRAGYLGF